MSTWIIGLALTASFYLEEDYPRSCPPDEICWSDPGTGAGPRVAVAACVDLPDDDRVTSPFGHVADIRSVEPLLVNDAPAGMVRTRNWLVGAIVTFRPVPGMTVARLQQVIDCHHARALVVEPSSADLLGLPGVSAQVKQVEDGFAVLIRAEEPQIAEEVLRRALALINRADPEVL